VGSLLETGGEGVHLIHYHDDIAELIEVCAAQERNCVTRGSAIGRHGDD
jgi:hypothetical protein